MGRRIFASSLLMLTVCLAKLPLARGQAALGGQPTRAATAPLLVCRPELANHSSPRLVALADEDWTTLLSETFEGTFPGSTWALIGDPTWGKTSYQTHGGSYSVYCAGGGSNPVSPPGPYPSEMDSWMVYGPFDLSQVADAEVQFFFRSKTELKYDYFALLASTDGQDWAGTGWSGDWVSECGGWCQETFSLSDVGDWGSLCGQPQVWIAFGFHSDADTPDEGSYLDDITLRAVAAGATPTLTATSTATPTATSTGQPSPTATREPSRTPTPTRTIPAGSRKVYLPLILRASAGRR
jgi:hypothetical protein